MDSLAQVCKRSFRVGCVGVLGEKSSHRLPPARLRSWNNNYTSMEDECAYMAIPWCALLQQQLARRG